jgi:hypothetical protein
VADAGERSAVAILDPLAKHPLRDPIGKLRSVGITGVANSLLVHDGSITVL